jgi:hypothetical protein
MRFGHTHSSISGLRARLAQRGSFQPSAIGSQLEGERIVTKCTLAHLVAENKKQVVSETNEKKMRLRARAKKSLESATECGKVDAGRAAPRESCLVRGRESVVHCRMLDVTGSSW